MPGELEALIEKAKQVPMTPEQQEKQRRSFAFANSKLENDKITKELIDSEADAMASEDGPTKQADP